MSISGNPYLILSVPENSPDEIILRIWVAHYSEFLIVARGMVGAQENKNGKSQTEFFFSVVTYNNEFGLGGLMGGFFVGFSSFLCPQLLSAYALCCRSSDTAPF